MTQHIVLLLINQYYPLLLFILTGVIATLILNTKEILSFYKSISLKTWLMFAAIVFIGLIIRLWGVAHIHHVYHDEFEHLSIAENMHFDQKYSVTIQGTYNQPEKTRMETWPPAYHTLLALSYNIFGACEKTAFQTTAAIGIFSIFLIFLFAYALFKNETVALCSAFILTFTPIHLKYCGSTATDIASFTLIMFSLLAAAFYVKYAKMKTLLLLIMTLSFAVYARPENGILLFLIPLFIVLFSHRTDFTRKKIITHIAFGSLLLTILLSFFFLQVFYYGYFTIHDAGWVDNLPTRLLILRKNLPRNISFWFGARHPLSVTLLAIFGLYKLRTEKKIIFFLTLWFCAFLAIYSIFKTGCFGSSASGETDRHALNLYIPVILSAAYGIHALSSRWRKNTIRTISIFSLLLLCVFCNSFLPLDTALSITLNEERHQEYVFILNNKNIIPDDVYVISYNPNIIISTIHKKAISPSLFLNLPHKPEKVMLFQDYWYHRNKKESLILDHFLMKNYDIKVIDALKNKTNTSALVMFELKKS